MAAGVARSTAWRYAKSDEKFAARCQEAEDEALDAIANVLEEAARNGDTATGKWLLSRRRPGIYGDRVAMEHSGLDGGPLVINIRWEGDECGPSN